MKYQKKIQKQLLQKSDETTTLSIKLKIEIDSGNNQKILSNENQDERTRLHELREISETMIVTANNKSICSSQTISCLIEAIKYIKTSKGRIAKKIIHQSDETTDISVKLNIENELGMKQKMLSKENLDDITRLDELRELLDNREREK